MKFPRAVFGCALALVGLTLSGCTEQPDDASAAERFERAMPDTFAPPWPAATSEWSNSTTAEWNGPVPKRVIVLGIDTLRADHLQGFGARRNTAPNLDRIATEEGVRFTRAFAQSSWTLPSMTSVFTSLYPQQHGVEDRGMRLSPKIPTLAGAFAAQGWMTAGFVTHIYVSSLFGLDSGFLTFRELSIDWNYNEGKQLRADDVFGHVVPWVHHHRDVPFFLYVHLFDPHWDYTPPAPFDRAFTDPEYSGPADGSWGYLSQFMPRDKLMPAEDLQRLIDLYDGEILYTDDAIGRFVDFLKSQGLWDDTLFVVLSDHGEEFQEHNSVHHIRTLYDEVLHVPLLIKPPRGRPETWRDAVSERVRNVDIAPTLLAMANLATPPSFTGESLLPLMRGPGKHRRSVAKTKTARYGQSLTSLHTQRYKLIVSDNGGGPLELFNWTQDPGELVNLAPEREDLARRLLYGLGNYVRTLEASRDQLEAALPGVDLTKEQEERLRTLGYIQ